MKRITETGTRAWMARLALMAALLLVTPAIFAQAPARFLGTITAISGNTVTVKTATGTVHEFEVPPSIPIQRIEPGQTNLSNAVRISLSDLDVGDRLLVLLNGSSRGTMPQAAEIIAIKHAALLQKQEAETEAWRQGVGGLVKSVDPATGTIMVNAGGGLNTKMVTVKTTSATILKRYAPASVSYADAQPAPITAIHPGDELMARGTKNADGTELTAQEVVSGSFRNISGLITSVDTANSTIVVKDLLTKKPVAVLITPNAQMRQLPEQMAQFLAFRLRGEAVAARYGGGAKHGEYKRPENGHGMPGAGPAEGERAQMNPQQVLDRAPSIKFNDLHKGEAVMLVATPGSSEVTAITLIAGVKPLLQAPASQDLLSSWSMSSGGAAAESGGMGGGEAAGGGAGPQ